jgi:hypothetical protein
LTDEDVVQPQPAEAPSMDDTIRETLARINSEPEETQEEKAERLRDERGRFAAQAKSEDTPSASAPAKDAPVAVPAEVPAEQKPVQDALAQAPSSWNAEAKAAWQALPPQVRQQALKREEDFHKGIEQYRQAANFGTGVYRAIQPHLQQIQDAGATPEVAIATLLKAEQTLRYGSMAQKRDAIGRMIQQYGITFDDSEPASGMDPQQILSQLPQMVRQTLAQERETWEVQQARNEVETFARAQDKYGLMNDWTQSPDGQPFSPFRELMRSAIQSGLAQDLKSAYEVAARAHPKSFERLTAEQQEAKEKERKEREAQRVAQARQASSVNVRPRGVLPAASPKGSMEDTIRGKLRELNS